MIDMELIILFKFVWKNIKKAANKISLTV